MDTSLKANMTKHLITVKETDDLNAAYSLMVKNNIRHLPAVNEEGHITGLISERDLQRAMRSDIAGEGFFRRESCEFPDNTKVMDYMSWPVRTVDKETTLQVVCHKMIREKISCFMVTDRGQILGLITTEDMLKVLHGLLKDPGSDLKLGLESLLMNPNIGQFAQRISDTGI